MGEFSLTHILIIVVLFLIFFGPSRLPAAGVALGKAIRNFKQSLSEIDIDSHPVENKPAENKNDPKVDARIEAKVQNENNTQEKTSHKDEVEIKKS